MLDVIIVGGGLIGCSFALDLAQQNPNLSICIIERTPLDFKPEVNNWDNKVYAITPHNYHHLSQQLALELDGARIGTITRMKVRGPDAFGCYSGTKKNAQLLRSSLIEFDSSAVNASYLAKIVEYRNLYQALIHKLSDYPNIELCNLTLQDIQMSKDSVKIISTCGSEIRARLLIGADGANSLVRSKFDFKVEQIPYFQSGVVANFSCEIPHQNVAHQWFTGDGILAYLPLAQQQISMVWATDDFQKLLNYSDEELCLAVSAAGAGVLGKLSLITKPRAFPLKLNLVNKFYQNRVILIGDAAHTIHPLAGQGLNLGFGDAWELASLIAKINLAQFDPLQLSRFNFSRLAEVRKMQLTCHLLQRLFHNRLPLIDKLRNLGLNLVNHLPLLKQALISSATHY